MTSVNEDLDLFEGELPQELTVDYMLSPGITVAESVPEEDLVIFCVDVSGSMCVTSAVPSLQGKRLVRHDQGLGELKKPAGLRLLPEL